MGLPFLNDLFLHQGDWTQILYRAELQGGANIYSASGIFPILTLCLQLGLSPVKSFNVLIFLIQFCFAFLSIRATLDFSELLKPQFKRSWFDICLLALIFAFAPIVGWRLTRGHEIIISGSLIFLCAFSWLLAIAVESVSGFLIFFTVVAITHIFSVPGQQTAVYGILFGAPILIGLTGDLIDQNRIENKTGVHRKRVLLMTLILVVLGSFALVLPHFVNLYRHALGPDSPRSLPGTISTYEYMTSQWRDWLTSIPWTIRSLSYSQRDFSFWHEINFAFGPPLLLILLFPWRNFRRFRAGLIFSLTLALLFSMNIKPFSTVLLKVFPLLKLFRVPQRSILSACSTILITACTALLATNSGSFLNTQREKWIRYLTVGATGILFIISYGFNPILREVLLWIFAGILPLIYFNRSFKDPFFSSIVLCILAFGSILATNERKLNFVEEKELTSKPQILKSQILKLAPDLIAPLNRVYLHLDIDFFNINTAYGLGLSSLDGYWFPNRRYLQLVSAIEGADYTSSLHYLHISTYQDAPNILKQLYNVIYDAYIENSQLVITHPTPDPAGQAWFSTDVRRLKDFNELAKELKSHGNNLGTKLHQTTWIVEEDSLSNSQAPVALSSACSKAEVRQIEAGHLQQLFKIQVSTPSDCILNVALNYSSELEAQGKIKESFQKLIPLPVNGSLLGVRVPSGTTEVVIEAKVNQGVWTSISKIIGLVLIVAAGFLKFLL